MKTTLEELLTVYHGMLDALQKETVPIEGHTDPNAITDCFRECHDIITDIMKDSIAESEAGKWKTNFVLGKDGIDNSKKYLAQSRGGEMTVWSGNKLFMYSVAFIAFRELPAAYQAEKGQTE